MIMNNCTILTGKNTVNIAYHKPW